MKKELQKEFSEEHHEVLKSIRVSKIILPILIGVGVVGYMLLKQYNPADFSDFTWTRHTSIWVGISLCFLVIKHMAYATRLRILSEREFSWSKCIELIFIWEFSSAVSPTSVGGSAVALFVLAQEKLSAAKTATLVIYSAILDTMFFIGTLPILILLLGPGIIRPGMTNFNAFDGWGYTFLVTYVLMLTYGSLFFYGLFINPLTMKKLLLGFTRIAIFRKYRHKAGELGNNLIIASKEMAQKNFSFHLRAFLSTAAAWSSRFLLLSCLVIAFVKETPLDFISQFELYARFETMFVIVAFSPTPGAAGVAEAVFGGFVTDYVTNNGVVLLITSIWRLFTFYTYLLIGVIIIPNWLRNVINRRKLQHSIEATTL